MFKHDCNKHGHRFEARYLEEPNKVLLDKLQSVSGNLRDILIIKKYIYDICIRCGKIVKEEKK